jgi:hypothetical protein
VSDPTSDNVGPNAVLRDAGLLLRTVDEGLTGRVTRWVCGHYPDSGTRGPPRAAGHRDGTLRDVRVKVEAGEFE